MADVFDWNESNVEKVRSHGITPQEAEEAMMENPIFEYSQQAEDEERELYLGETKRGRILAVAITYREEQIRVITAYPADADQKRRYHRKRAKEQQ